MTGSAGERGRRLRRPPAAASIAALLVAASSALATAVGPGPARAAPRSDPAACRTGPARNEVLAGIGPRGEIRLASGARAVLAALRWPDRPEAAAAAQAWLDLHRGADLTLVPRGSPDRWGRERADILVAADDTDLAGGLIAAGLAYADAGEADSLCRPALRLLEAQARRARHGLWRDALPAATDGPALRALAGRFTVVEGQIRHVGERGARTYLDFAARGVDALTITVPKRTWRMVLARGLSAASLEGRLVRVRGIVEIWRGPVIEAAADSIEVLE